MKTQEELEAEMVRQAIAEGERDEDRLTDELFFARHPERHGRRISRREREEATEWTWLREDVVRPALAATATCPGPAPATGSIDLFDSMWTSHPTNQVPEDWHPCGPGKKEGLDNQCVIRLGLSFVRAGVRLDSYPGAVCWFGHGRQHPLRVEEMTRWLNSADADFLGTAEISKRDGGRQRTSDDYVGRRGVVACLNFWGTGDQGDHIDLWNGAELAGGKLDYFERSEEIWFWEMP